MKWWQKCPVCDGRGLVSGGYFDSPGYIDEQGNRHWTASNAMERCRVCQGSGIIQTPDDVGNEKSLLNT